MTTYFTKIEVLFVPFLFKFLKLTAFNFTDSKLYISVPGLIYYFYI